jgi:hypothetical protein
MGSCYRALKSPPWQVLGDAWSTCPLTTLLRGQVRLSRRSSAGPTMRRLGPRPELAKGAGPVGCVSDCRRLAPGSGAEGRAASCVAAGPGRQGRLANAWRSVIARADGRDPRGRGVTSSAAATAQCTKGCPLMHCAFGRACRRGSDPAGVGRRRSWSGSGTARAGHRHRATPHRTPTRLTGARRQAGIRLQRRSVVPETILRWLLGRC